MKDGTVDLRRRAEAAEAERDSYKRFLRALCGHLIREIMPIRRRFRAESLVGLNRHDCWLIGSGEGMKHTLITIAREHPEAVQNLEDYGNAVTLDADKVQFRPFDLNTDDALNKLERQVLGYRVYLAIYQQSLLQELIREVKQTREDYPLINYIPHHALPLFWIRVIKDHIAQLGRRGMWIQLTPDIKAEIAKLEAERDAELFGKKEA